VQFLVIPGPVSVMLDVQIASIYLDKIGVLLRLTVSANLLLSGLVLLKSRVAGRDPLFICSF
jgi:hypothetical protein